MDLLANRCLGMNLISRLISPHRQYATAAIGMFFRFQQIQHIFSRHVRMCIHLRIRFAFGVRNLKSTYLPSSYLYRARIPRLLYPIRSRAEPAELRGLMYLVRAAAAAQQNRLENRFIRVSYPR